MSRGTPKKVRPAVSKGEFLNDVKALSDADLAWLNRTATFLAAPISGWSGEDLLQAATYRTLRGTRHCPVGLNVVVHLVRTMQSIAYRERQKARGAETAWSEIECNRTLEDDPQARLERDEAERALRSRVADAFAHHPNARRVALGTLDGLVGSELRKFTGLDQVAYESARRAMHRELERYLSGVRA
jgi:hypothetical protein